MLNINRSYAAIAENISIDGVSLFSMIKSASSDYNVSVVDEDFVRKALPERDRFANKYTFGRCLSVCGSYGMAGAAILAAKAAYRSGVGLVDLILPSKIYPIVANEIPEAVFMPSNSRNYLTHKDTDKIIKRASLADAMLIGCGLSRNSGTEYAVKEILKEVTIPTVIDADGINALIDSIEILERTDWEKVITPHMGEMARLIGISAKEIQKDFINIAAEFAVKHNVCVVLKGAVTVVATPDKNLYLNFLCGNSGMAVGGSGDVLAGIICALISSGISIDKASAAAVYIHARAGDIAAQHLSQRSLIPSDIIDALPCLFKSFE